MILWVDGDACPRVIKDILFKTAIRKQIVLMFVANQPISVPVSIWIKKWQVTSGFDKADQYIIEHVNAGDLVITADIPFAHEAIMQGAFALNPRGELYSSKNIGQHLARRNTNEYLRSCYQFNSTNNKLTSKEVHLFANHLDKFIHTAPQGTQP